MPKSNNGSGFLTHIHHINYTLLIESTKILLFLALLLSLNNSDAQKNDYIWLMGYGGLENPTDTTWGVTALDFNSDPPSMYYVDEGTASFEHAYSMYCDDDGVLEAYTNNARVWSKDHEIMTGGERISVCDYWFLRYDEDLDDHWGFSGTDYCIFLEHPRDENKVSLVHQDLNFNIQTTPLSFTESIFYSEITLGATNQLTTVDSIIFQDTLKRSSLAAVRHANGRDWWISSWGVNHDSMYLFLLDPDKIKLQKRLDFGPKLDISFFGQSLYSPSGELYGQLHTIDGQEQKKGVFLYNFNRCSGDFELIMLDTLNESLFPSTGMAFSQKERFWYVTLDNFIYQYDLKADDIKESRKIVAIWDGFEYKDFWDTDFGPLWLAPDGKIYGATNGASNRYLHRIEYPDRKGTKCEVQQHVLYTNTTMSPTVPKTANHRLGPIDGSPCDSLGINNYPVANWRYQPDTSDAFIIDFFDLSYFEPTEWTWDFGDNTKSHYHSPSHPYSEPGIYEVCLTVSNQFQEDKMCKTLYLGTSSTSEEYLKTQVEIFPNPVSYVFNCNINNYIPKNGNLEIRNQFGHLIQEQKAFFGTNTIDVHHLSPGIYYLAILDQGKIINTAKFIKI